ncbi:MAG: glycerol acyltransferase [Bacteroidota bacterium]|jgi:1-acyl-sn-glycerol-3-phosphate acyltransferase|nr:glycerol acyltransferase [Bacteroidota bacterium]
MGFVIAVYFKRAKVKNAKNLQVKGPVIITMNHPNAFMDPIALTTLIYPPRLRYLARGDAFKKGVVSALLESLGIIPIYRIQDGGKEGLKKNDATYERVNELLKRNKKIIIFAEGLCVQERRLRPLKKGVPRMILGCMENNQLSNLIVVPVGINYSNPSQFRSTLFCNVGEPIKMADYLKDYEESPAKTMNQFLADLTPRMKELIIHIDDQHNEQVIAHIEEIYRYDYFKKEKLKVNNLQHDFMFSTKVVDVINNAEKVSPAKVRALDEKTKHYFSELKKYHIKDWLISPVKQSSVNYRVFILRLLLILITVPIYIRGLLASYLPYRLSYEIMKKKVRVVEFKASFNMGIGAVLFLVYFSLQFFIAKALAPNAWWALLVLFISVLTSLFCLWISPFRKKTWGILKVLKLKSSQPQVIQNLSSQRKEIIRMFEELS